MTIVPPPFSAPTTSPPPPHFSCFPAARAEDEAPRGCGSRQGGAGPTRGELGGRAGVCAARRGLGGRGCTTSAPTAGCALSCPARRRARTHRVTLCCVYPHPDLQTVNLRALLRDSGIATGAAPSRPSVDAAPSVRRPVHLVQRARAVWWRVVVDHSRGGGGGGGGVGGGRVPWRVCSVPARACPQGSRLLRVARACPVESPRGAYPRPPNAPPYDHPPCPLLAVVCGGVCVPACSRRCPPCPCRPSPPLARRS